MATKTTNYQLIKPDNEDFYDVQVQNENMDLIDAALTPTADPTRVPTGLTGRLSQWVSWLTNRIKAITGKSNWYDEPATTLEEAKAHADAAAPHSGHETPAGAQAKANAAAAAVQTALDTHKADYIRQPGYGTATGTNSLAVTLNPAPTAYVDGMAISFKNTNQNTGAVSLNVNGLGAKAVVKANGNALVSGNLKAGSIYTVRYNASTENFILQGEGGEYGTAGAQHVLKPYTIVTEDGIVTGAIQSKAAQIYYPGQYDQVIAAGQYLQGAQTIAAVSFDASRVLTGTTIAGKTGTMPNNGDQTATIQVTGSSKPVKTIPNGYTSGGTITVELASSLASVIRKGVVVGGVAGTYGDPPRDGLIAEYLFDNVSGSTVYDTSGNGLNGTASNVSYYEGKHGIAAYFNGNNSKIVLGLTNSHIGSDTSPFSISLWCKPNYIPSSGRTGIFRLDNGSGGVPCFVGFGLTSEGWCLSRGQSSYLNLYSNSGSSVGVWHHVIIENTGTTLNLYIDSVLVTSGAVERVIDANLRYVTLGSVYIGSNWYSGYIDSVRVYNRVLTAEEKNLLFMEV